MGKGWGAGTADYISHHAQHCGPHQTKKEVDPFTWIPRGPEEGRGRDRRLRRRLFTKFLVRCVVCVLLSCTVSLQPSVAFHETSIVRACENPVLCLKLDRFCLKPFVVKKKRGGWFCSPSGSLPSAPCRLQSKLPTPHFLALLPHSLVLSCILNCISPGKLFRLFV